jgi:hypothetical protein
VVSVGWGVFVGSGPVVINTRSADAVVDGESFEVAVTLPAPIVVPLGKEDAKSTRTVILIELPGFSNVDEKGNRSVIPEGMPCWERLIVRAIGLLFVKVRLTGMENVPGAALTF